MITWFARHTSRLVVALAFMFTIAACGGGGGGSSSGGGGFLPDEGSPDYKIELELTDLNGNVTNSVSESDPALLTVSVRSGGNGVAGLVVSADSDIGQVFPAASGTALTDEDGIALFKMESDGVVGAGTITASVTVDGETFSESLTFQVLRPDLRIGYFDGNEFIDGEIALVPEDITSSASAVLAMAIVDESGELVFSEEVIFLRSDCANSGEAILPKSVATSTGQATATYTAAGCEGDDLITATLDNSGAQAFGTVNIAAAEVGSLNFVSAVPELIAIKGTGGSNRQETSDVTFIAIDGGGAPIPGVLVEFTLSTEIGGLSLAEDSAITATDGTVVAVVQSGSVATPVRVIATVEVDDDDFRSTISDSLVVSTGLPDANSISLSSEVLNVGGALDIDGVTTKLTVRMADKYNNPVADGTSAVFTTEYGSIEDTCSTLGGACSVTWTSQSPRFPTFGQEMIRTIDSPDYRCTAHSGSGGPCPDDMGEIRGLRSAVTVYAIGEEFFIDQNGNGLYDEGETFENLPEAFSDNNEDRVFTPAVGPMCGPPSTEERCIAGGAEEEFKDFNQDGEYSLNVFPPEFPNGFYNGTLCPAEGDGVYCSQELLVVSDSLDLIMSASSGYSVIVIRDNGSVVSTITEGQTLFAYTSDFYNNRPPKGTGVTISTKGDCSLLSEGSFSVPDSNQRGAFGGMRISVEGDGEAGTLTIAVATPGGAPTSRTYNCSTTAPEPEPEPTDGGLTLGG
ncbi:MAG: hypothetical protein V7746_01560 [Halioglobus sp.]